MLTRTQAISEFLASQECKIDLYKPSLEVQVNTIAGPEKIKKEKGFAWSDGEIEWSPFRIPYGGQGIDATPHYTDSHQSWPLEKYAEGVGLTGWDWFHRRSLWVGFDFDSIHNHSQGLTDRELDILRTNISEIPWLQLRHSKSGKGYHIYVFLKDPPETQNHTEHAALAKSILSHLSGLLDFDFNNKVDTAGGVLWIWHKDASHAKQSFKLIKQCKTYLDYVPNNWRDYIQVKSRGGKASNRRSLTDKERAFDDLLTKTRRHSLDDQHRELLSWLSSNHVNSWWDAERNMLVTHTYVLKQAHRELNLKGIYDTVATGKDLPGDNNCFMFPNRRGAWSVYRYGLPPEHGCWGQTNSGWVHTVFNKQADLGIAARLSEGVKTKTGEYKFKNLSSAITALEYLGNGLSVPAYMLQREATLAPGKNDNEIVVTVPYEDNDNSLIDWYITGGARTRKWECVVTTVTEAELIEAPDEVVRHVTKPDGSADWHVLSRNHWNKKTKDDCKSALKALGYKTSELDKMLGQAVLDDWRETRIPFQPEYPGDRCWNKDAPQLKYDPYYGEHPTWNLMIDHVGQTLDTTKDEWCHVYNVQSSRHYLMLWLANVIRHPFEPLPYLFLWGPENSGKSIFHEAIKECLFYGGKGYTKADQALTNNNGFNGELYGAVVAAVEEVDVSKTTAHNRIKDWVTGRDIFIRPLWSTGFICPNTTHWIQCSNYPDYCPIFPGDTRISVGWVGVPTKEIPKNVLLDKLRAEAPAFIYTLLNMDLPPAPGRLKIPVLGSSLKEELQEKHKDPVVNFIESYCTYEPGVIVDADLFVSAFIKSLPDGEKVKWSRAEILKRIPIMTYPRGTYSNKMHIGNINFEIHEQLAGKKISNGHITKDGRKLVGN